MKNNKCIHTKEERRQPKAQPKSKRKAPVSIPLKKYLALVDAYLLLMFDYLSLHSQVNGGRQT